MTFKNEEKQNSNFKTFLTTTLFSISCILAVLVFQNGFLLKRQEIRTKSSCSDVKGNGNSCWMTPQYNRIIFLLIDALRYDFIQPISTELRNEQMFYRGHMRHLAELIKNQKASIGTLIVDPPTTTLQRIKALTTGTLPTFIDAGDNFSPDTVVQEDNFLYQTIQQNKTSTLLGDDTWLSLFPTSFKKSVAFDSFDINDLNSVDDAIRPKLMEEIETSNSSLIIAHFLGIDHCGHKFGPHHPIMSHMIRKMDKIVADATKLMKEDDLLIMMGDHGMTSTGDHGGESDDEIRAGIFVFSKKKLIKLPSVPMHQINIVPTLSLLLGLPIPFSNLGTVIVEMFPKILQEEAIAVNYEQIKRFAEVYSNMNKVRNLHGLTAREANSAEEQLLAMNRIQTSLRISWTQFNDSNINISLLSFIEAILFLIGKHPMLCEWIIVRSGFILLQGAVLFDNSNSHTAAHTLLTMSLSVSCLSSLFSLFQKSLQLKKADFGLNSRLIGIIAVIGYSITTFSNSFIVYEANLLTFLLQIIFISILIPKLKKCLKPRKIGKLNNLIAIILKSEDAQNCLIAILILRTQKYFHRCREEEVDCFVSSATKTSTSLSYEDQIYRLMFSGFSISLNSLYILRENIPIKDSTRIIRATTWPIIIFVVLHSININSDSIERANLLAQIIYASSFLGFIACLATKSNGLLSAQFLLFPVYILLGDGLQPAVVLFFHLILIIRKIVPKETIPTIISLLIPFGFYLTGHSPVISAIPWTSAFIGIPSSMALRFLPGLMIIMHLNISIFFVSSLNNSKNEKETTSLVLAAFKMFCTCVAASLHRRHLMVWKIFAPKFIFDAVAFLFFLICNFFLKMEFNFFYNFNKNL